MGGGRFEEEDAATEEVWGEAVGTKPAAFVVALVVVPV